MRLEVDAPCEIWLKLECLQPIGSFKLRGAASAIRQAGPDAWRDGVWTTSAGNMAQGVCWVARELGVPATVVAPDHAPRAKLDAVERLGGRVIAVPFETWWETMETGSSPGLDGLFVHPVLDERVMAGNGVIGLELAEQLDAIDTVLVAWGGGGLYDRHRERARRDVAVDPRRRLRAGDRRAARSVARGRRAGRGRLPAVVRRRRRLEGAAPRDVGASAVAGRRRGAVPLAEAAAAVRLLATRAHVVAEGAGALPLAAALAGHGGTGRVVCIVSGGNIDPDLLAAILSGETPA